MTTGFVTHGAGHRLAPATPVTTTDGTTVERMGLWPAGAPAPWVLTVDEIAIALAHSGGHLGRYGATPIVAKATDLTVQGVRAAGRGPLACAAARLREGNELDVFPADAHPHRCLLAASDLCRKANRDRPPH
ncbi:hypothetical protein ATK36_3770 [Amycolatopsis sulphurea]|uniref:Uncharacterized protein n=1 Tax=Amycolatopsis sulphurea TaxID=76022 RepID=A0A2A9FBX8_9PSEU|nr:hypothetical protein [Amycolatopsis sulphurea]PFG48668.1 hypothetical protein ATK36_3770 [Amycolatopsis sulphurea]